MADLVEIRRNPETSYEPSDWPLRPIACVFLGTFLFLVMAPLVLLVAYPGALSDTSRRLYVELPAPRLEVAPDQDLARLRAEEERRRDTYYWIDKQKGIVHIPVAQAMQKLARDGIPGFPKAAP